MRRGLLDPRTAQTSKIQREKQNKTLHYSHKFFLQPKSPTRLLDSLSLLRLLKKQLRIKKSISVPLISERGLNEHSVA